jgi:hypothetical protein
VPSRHRALPPAADPRHAASDDERADRPRRAIDCSAAGEERLLPGGRGSGRPALGAGGAARPPFRDPPFGDAR